jgi:hypothetical protein
VPNSIGSGAILFGTIFAPWIFPKNLCFSCGLLLRSASLLRLVEDMSKREKSKLRDSDVVGLKSFDRLMPLLERQLFFDPYCAYILLFLFNPLVDSLRGLQQASELKKYRRSSAAPARRSARFRKPSKSSIPNPSSKSPANWPLNSNRWATTARFLKSNMRT